MRVCRALFLFVLTVACTPSPTSSLQQAQRIASATLHTDELLLRMLPPQRILSLSTAADDPMYSPVLEQSKLVELRTPAEAEALAALAPDLVLTSSWMVPEKIEALRALGVRVEVLPIPLSGESIIEQYLEWGEKLGAVEKARELADEMLSILNEPNELPAPRDSLTIIDLPMGGVTGGSGSLWNDMCRQAGLTNMAETLTEDAWGMVSLGAEKLLALNPMFLHSSYVSLEELAKDPVYGLLDAVKNSRVMRLPPSLHSSPGYGFWQAVRLLRENLRRYLE